MQVLLVRYYIRNTRGSGPDAILSGHYIETLWDDVSNNFVVNEFDDASDTTPTLRTNGPDLGHVSTRGRTRPPADADIVNLVNGVIPYSYCAGTTLESFKWKSSFPYAEIIHTANSFQCISQVCDIAIDEYSSTNASDTTTSDGSINVVASSSHGPIKYGLSNFDYATGGQSTGLFNGLLAGAYTVIVKDSLNCTLQINITVGVPNFYNVKYRLEYGNVKGFNSRIDILERGYEGEIIEVCGGDDPFVLDQSYNDTNKFIPVIPSYCEVTLISNENFYFKDLFTQDDRKYQIRYYKDYGVRKRPVRFINESFDTEMSPWQNNDPGSRMPWYWQSGGFLASGATYGVAETAYLMQQNPSGGKWPAGKYTLEYKVLNSSSAGTGISPVEQISIRTFENSDLNTPNIPSDVSGNLSLTRGQTTSDKIYFILSAPVDNIAFIIQGTSGTHVNVLMSYLRMMISPYENYNPGLVLEWKGYVIPQNYKEPYIAPPYTITVTATDGLADLKTFDFVDKDSNKFTGDVNTFASILEILKKTDLDINIQSGVNKYEDQMDKSSTDDPLNQCKFDASTFYDNGTPEDCMTVLSEILKPFGAVIRQREAKWFIYCSEQIVDNILYREYTIANEFVSSSFINGDSSIKFPTIKPRAAFRDKSQVLEVIPAYGIFYLDYKLQKNPSLVKSYSFEIDDVLTDPNGFQFLKNWNVNILNDPGSFFGIKETKAFEGNYNFFVKAGTTSTPNTTTEVVLTSITGQIEYESVDLFEFSFSYAAILGGSRAATTNPFWVRLKWMIKIGNLYYDNLTSTWTDDINSKYNVIYVDSFNSTETFKILANLPDVGDLTLNDFYVEFIFQRNVRVDFFNAEATTNLKAIPTVNLPIGSKVKGQGNGTPGSGRYKYYNLVEDNGDVTDGIQPDDYDATDNAKLWVKESETSERNEKIITYMYLDNVVLKHYPNGAEPPETITTEVVNNKNLKINFEDEFLLNDIDIDNINNSERTYRNYFKRLNGSPTQIWSRIYRSGDGKLLDLLVDDYKRQYNKGTNKITGSFDLDMQVLPSDCMRETGDNSRKYMFMGYRYHDRSEQLEFDIAEIVDVINDEDSPDIGAGFTIGFSKGFNS